MANLREAKEIISFAIEVKQPVLLLGSPGIGKTEVIETTAKQKGISCKIFEAPSLDPTDIRGLLYVTEGQAHFTRSPLLPCPKRDGERGILLIDELTSGLPSVQVALHSLFHPRERRLGEHRLPEGWVPMATGNRIQDGAGAHKLLTALADRVLIVEVEANFDIWKEDYALKKEIHPVVLGFLNFRPELFNTFERRNGDSGKDFATPRGHTMVSEVLKRADTLSESALKETITGYVGRGVGIEYVAFLRTYRSLPDIEEIFAGKDIIPTDPSVLYALIAALIHAVIAKNEQKRIDRLLEYALKIKEQEFGGLLIKDLVTAAGAKVVARSKIWPRVATQYRFLLE